LVTTYDITLVVGSVQDTVNVEAASQSINTENGQLTGTNDRTDITKLPIFTVSPYELATTLPGVQIVDNTISAGFSNGINIQVNGHALAPTTSFLTARRSMTWGLAGRPFSLTSRRVRLACGADEFVFG
jgi:hypothetical protein